MKEFRSRIFFIAAAFALSIYLLYPTFSDYQNTTEINQKLSVLADSIKNVNPDIAEDELEITLAFLEDSLTVGNEDIKSAREKRIKLGLDLQGGMYLVMEVNTAKLIEKLAKDPDPTFEEVMREAENIAANSDDDFVAIISSVLTERGIRLSRYFGSIREEDDEIISRLQEQEEDAVQRAIEIINNRVNQYGVSEPSIQPQGARRIVVELYVPEFWFLEYWRPWQRLEHCEVNVIGLGTFEELDCFLNALFSLSWQTNDDEGFTSNALLLKAAKSIKITSNARSSSTQSRKI